MECKYTPSREARQTAIGLSSLSDETSGLADQEAVRADLLVVDDEHVGGEVLLVLNSLGSAAGKGARLGLLRNFRSLLSDFASIGETTVGTSHAKKRKEWKFWNCRYLAKR